MEGTLSLSHTHTHTHTFLSRALSFSLAHILSHHISGPFEYVKVRQQVWKAKGHIIDYFDSSGLHGVGEYAVDTPWRDEWDSCHSLSKLLSFLLLCCVHGHL